MFHNPNEVRQDDRHVREAVRFGAIVGAVGLAFALVAAVWVSTCAGSTADAVACGAPQRTLLAVGAPVILLVGGVRAFVRTYRTSRNQEPSWAWQGAGWFLMTLMLVVVATSMAPLGGPAVFGA